MAFSWTPRLALGFEPIDRQHRELFGRVDRLLRAVESGDSAHEVLHTLAFLGEYIATHFADEERLMAERGYPAAAAHAAEHARFVSTFSMLRAGFALSGATVSLGEAVRRELCDWLESHVAGTDGALGAFLRGARARRAEGTRG